MFHPSTAGAFDTAANLDQVYHLVRAAESFSIASITGIPDHSGHSILRFLDRGLQGIIVPHASVGEQDVAIARDPVTIRTATVGWATAGPRTTASEFPGTTGPSRLPHKLRRLQDKYNIQADRNVDDILRVSGADVLHVAPSYLGQSQGRRSPSGDERGHPTDPCQGQFRCDGRQRYCHDAGVVAIINQGANFATVSAWGLLRIGAEDFLSHVKAAL